MEKYGAYFRQLRGDLTQDQVADLAGVTPQAVSQWENDKSTPAFDAYFKLIEGLSRLRKVPSPMDLVHTGPAPLRQVQLLGAVPEETIGIAMDYSPMCVGVRIADGAMEPTFRRGDVVILDPAVPPMPGDMVLAQPDNGEPVFRKYTISEYDKSGRPVMALLPLNPDWPEIRMDAKRPGRILGTLIEHRTFGRRR